ncbi:MAG TPA: ABC transporter ATP-binding protein [Dongiaceae bacterium]|jgi:ABC-2 type transport system ATP-binding protein|nr:ABC transporter ATP-binding protein [Dongiaceae bacterium]
MTNAVIEAKGLTKRYGTRAALDHIDLAIEEGEVFGLLGPNGAGKTTTILMIMGLTDVSEGTVRVLRLDPARQPLVVKRHIGYMPDSVGFYDTLTARENLAYTGRLAGLERQHINRRIEEVLARVGLGAVVGQKVCTFSRGMKQRLGLADALLKSPKIVILDEPTSGLDPQATQEFLDLIRTLKQEGITIILSSHMLEKVQAICDRVALFNAGRIALCGTVNDLGRQVLGGGHRILVEARGGKVEQALAAIPGIIRVRREGEQSYVLEADSDIRPLVAATVSGAGSELLSLGIRQASLESVYTRYFAEVAHAA